MHLAPDALQNALYSLANNFDLHNASLTLTSYDINERHNGATPPKLAPYMVVLGLRINTVFSQVRCTNLHCFPTNKPIMLRDSRNPYSRNPYTQTTEYRCI